MAYSTHREERCQALFQALPDNAKPGKTTHELLGSLSDHYCDCKNDDTRLRTLQQDLKHLRENGDIVCDSTPGRGSTLRYRRAPQETAPTGNVNLEYLYQDLIDRGISAKLAADFVRQVQHPASYYDLPEAQFVSVPETVRLTPNLPPDPTIQAEIVQALNQRCVLKAFYRKPGDQPPTGRRLHPLGILLRGTLHYLIAYDEKDFGPEKPPAKMFLINRLEDAAVLPDEPAKIPAEASVADLVRKEGLADFVHDPGLVTVKLRVWDYLLRLLQENRIAPDQTFDREKDGDSAIVTARLMLSGTLYRWLMGFGDKVEVLEPESLRRAIARQACKVTDCYGDVYEEAEEDEDAD